MLAIAERRRPRPADCFSFGTSRHFLSSVGGGAFCVPNAPPWASGVLSKGRPLTPFAGGPLSVQVWLGLDDVRMRSRVLNK